MLALLPIGTFVALAIPREAPRFTEAQYEVIEPGMTEEEVERILGGPPGDYRANGFVALPEKPFDTEYGREWVGDRGSITILFHNDNHRVSMTGFVPEVERWQDRLRTWCRSHAPSFCR
jgi:hypothetical protein